MGQISHKTLLPTACAASADGALSAPKAGPELRRKARAVPRIEDWPTIRLAAEQCLLKQLEDLQQRMQKTKEILEGKNVSGLVHAGTSEEMAEYGLVKGTQALVLRIPGYDKVVGLALYDVDTSEVAPEDDKLLKVTKAFAANPANEKLRKATAGKKLGIANLAVIDPIVGKPVEEGGFGIKRNYLYRLMMGYIAAECRDAGNDMLLACCFFNNKAMRSHVTSGWKVLTAETFYLYDEEKVPFQVIGFDLKGTGVNRLISHLYAENQKDKISIIDIDPRDGFRFPGAKEQE